MSACLRVRYKHALKELKAKCKFEAYSLFLRACFQGFISNVGHIKPQKKSLAQLAQRGGGAPSLQTPKARLEVL